MRDALERGSNRDENGSIRDEAAIIELEREGGPLSKELAGAVLLQGGMEL